MEQFTQEVKQILEGKVTATRVDASKRYLIKYNGKSYRVDIIGGKHRSGEKFYNSKEDVIKAFKKKHNISESAKFVKSGKRKNEIVIDPDFEEYGKDKKDKKDKKK